MINEKVSRETMHQFIELLIKWNKVINLVSVKNAEDLWERHVKDSMQLLEFIQDKNVTLLDIGSGAGFPGLIMSFCGVKEVILVESDERKSAFLTNAARLSENKVTVLNKRIEDVEGVACDIITSRGVSHLNILLGLIQKVKLRDKCLFLKGKNYLQEIKEAKKYWNFDEVIYNSVTSDEGRIIAIRNIK
jgi:16S rRNA (guanine527-N7)-methyltransferase